MTKERFLETVKLYQTVLNSTATEDIGTPQQAAFNVFPGRRDQLRHLASMCDRMANLYEHDTEKAMRWLGFMQGVLWSLNIYTLDDLCIHNSSQALMP